MTGDELLLGVDGGGTATVAWLSTSGRGDGDPLGRGRAGPSNPRAVGFERGLANLDFAINTAFADAGRDRGPVVSACLAIAGADRESERGPLRAWATARGLSERLRIVNDAEPVLACGAPEGWGVALISGRSRSPPCEPPRGAPTGAAGGRRSCRPSSRRSAQPTPSS
jgi:N-acetylglucosamine kinase-like BadF-type ATPase